MGSEAGEIEMADDIVMYGDILAERIPVEDNDFTGILAERVPHDDNDITGNGGVE